MTRGPLDWDFVDRMAHEVLANAGKGDWRALIDSDDPEVIDWHWVFEELDDHVRKLKEAVQRGYGLSLIQEHAADVACNAMFAFRFARNDHERVEEYLRELEEV